MTPLIIKQPEPIYSIWVTKTVKEKVEKEECMTFDNTRTLKSGAIEVNTNSKFLYRRLEKALNDAAEAEDNKLIETLCHKL